MTREELAKVATDTYTALVTAAEESRAQESRAMDAVITSLPREQVATAAHMLAVQMNDRYMESMRKAKAVLDVIMKAVEDMPEE